MKILSDFIINFADDLDPNMPNSSYIHWPKYTTKSPSLMTFLDGTTPLSITQDSFRKAGIEFLTRVTTQYPV